MAAKTRSKFGKPPEKTVHNKRDETLAEIATKVLKKRKEKKRDTENSLDEEQSVGEDCSQEDERLASREESPASRTPELPYKDVPSVPNVPRKSKHSEAIESKEVPNKVDTGYKNRSPLQADERAREILRDALKQPICLTGEDLMNVSEPLRQEMKRLVTKKRVEQKIPAFSNTATETTDQWPIIEIPEEVSILMVEKLPLAGCEVLTEEREGLEKGAVVIGDPVMQYLATLTPGNNRKERIVAKESCGLKAVYPLINNVGEVESLLDSGSQIVSMAKDVAEGLRISWDPRITIEMESANRTVKRTCGLARNVPFVFETITVHLQVHIMDDPAYKILLGRPFETVTESLVRNDKDGCQSLILTDPNTGKSCIVRTYERGKPPTILRRPIPRDFRSNLMN